MYRIYRKIPDSLQGDFVFLSKSGTFLKNFFPISGLISWSLPDDEGGITCMTEGWEKLKLHLSTYIKKTYCKPSEQLFPNRRPLSHPNLTKNMKTHIRIKQHKNSTPKTQTN